jgi:hypothetical protein
LTLATPDQVSTVTGNPVANAIRNTLALQLDGNTKNESGSQAVAGRGPTRRSTGCTQ